MATSARVAPARRGGLGARGDRGDGHYRAACVRGFLGEFDRVVVHAGRREDEEDVVRGQACFAQDLAGEARAAFGRGAADGAVHREQFRVVDRADAGQAACPVERFGDRRQGVACACGEDHAVRLHCGEHELGHVVERGRVVLFDARQVRAHEVAVVGAGHGVGRHAGQ